MIRRSVTAAIGAAVLFATTQASAQSGFYIHGDVGDAFSTDTSFKDNALFGPGLPVKGDSGNSVIIDAGVGYRFAPAFRADVTAGYIPSLHFSGTGNIGLGGLTQTQKADVDSIVGMVNGYLDFAGLFPTAFGRFQPYIDGGVGVARNHVGTSTLTVIGVSETLPGADHTDFAWNAGGGIGFALTDNVVLDLAYRYYDLGEMRTGAGVTGGAVPGIPVNAVKADLQVHTVTLGARFSF